MSTKTLNELAVIGRDARWQGSQFEKTFPGRSSPKSIRGYAVHIASRVGRRLYLANFMDGVRSQRRWAVWYRAHLARVARLTLAAERRDRPSAPVGYTARPKPVLAGRYLLTLKAA